MPHLKKLMEIEMEGKNQDAFVITFIYIFSIDKYEFDKWRSNTERVASSTYETSTSDIHFNETNSSRFSRNRYATYETAAVSSDLTHEKAIETNSLEETNRYLERAVDIYKDPDPLIIRKAATETPMTYQQRIFVRYLQPPDLPPPGVIK